MTRQRYVSARRPRRQNAGPVRASELWGVLARAAAQRFERYEGHYGSLNGSWIPSSLRTPARKLLLLIQVALGGPLERMGKDVGEVWTVDAETNSGGDPIRLLISGSGPAVSVPIAVTGAGIKIGGYEIALRARDAGERILERLLDEIAAVLASPA